MNEQVVINGLNKPSNHSSDLENPSAREQEVLSVVLDLMVEEGDGFSMAKVAKRAACSKETLYRWFGDRDGLLTATVQWQASKVAMPKLDQENVTIEAFCKTLQDFAKSWITVITGDVSIALNRLAVSHAGNGATKLGDIVLLNGPLAMQKRLEPIFELGKTAGFLKSELSNAFRVFFGLVVADTQVRVLLGDADRPTVKEIKQIAEGAVKEFMVLFGTQLSNTQIQTGE